MRTSVSFALALLAGCAGIALAESPIGPWIGPGLDLESVRPGANYDATYAFEEKTSDRNREMSWVVHDLIGLLPLRKTDQDFAGLGTQVRVFDFVDTDIRFPDTRDAFPDHLWDIELAPMYGRKLNNGWLAGGLVSIGSPSDRPFASGDEITVNATGLLRIPDGPRNAWLLFLNYSNNREWLENIPIPGAGYWYNPNDQLQALLGFPYMSFRWRPIDRLTLDASYLVPRTIDTRIGYDVLEDVQLYAGFHWDHDIFLRHDRDDDDDRLFYYEKKVQAGVKWVVAQNVTLDLAGGFAFDRFWFEGEEYDDRGDNRIDVDDGPFIKAELAIRF